MSSIESNGKKRFLLLAFLFIFSLSTNIFAHELSHFVVADAYGLEPTMHFSDLSEINNARGFIEVSGQPIAYVSYDAHSAEYDKSDLLIALAGPLVNILLGLTVLLIYFRMPSHRRTLYTNLVIAVIALPALLAGLLNFIPMNGSDGEIIFKCLKNIF